MKKILVLTDFSKYAGYASRVAASLAKQHNAEIIALYMISPSDAFLTRKESLELFENINYRKRIDKQFDKFLDQEYLKDVKVNTHILRDVDFHKINEVTRELEIDLIVMGSRGRDGLKDLFVGSNTEKIVRNVEIPVLVVKDRITDFTLNKVALACDFDLDMTKAFVKAWEFFKSINTNFDIVYVNAPEYFSSSWEMENKAAKFLNHCKLKDDTLFEKIVYYSDFNIMDGLYNYAGKVDADLVVILTHGRKGLGHILYSSYGESIARSADFPIMTIKT